MARTVERRSSGERRVPAGPVDGDELARQQRRPTGGPGDFVEIALGSDRQVALGQGHLGVPQDCAQQVVDVVGDRPGLGVDGIDGQPERIDRAERPILRRFHLS